MARWNELGPFDSPRHHEPGCNGRCDGRCSADMRAAFFRAYGDGQAPVASETRASVRDRIPTSPLGVETMAEVVAGGRR